jgi:polyisoprenoid-binding protein YceI
MPVPPRALTLALPLALGLLTAPIVAQMPAQQPGQPDKTRVAAGTYTADANHSQIGWRLNHMGFNDTLGLIGGETGTLVLDPAHPAASKVSVQIPVANIMAADSGLTAELLKPGADGGKPAFFGAAPAPATFESTKVTLGADGTSAKVDGTLTLNGVTRPVSVDVRFIGAGTNPMKRTATVGFEGSATIKRSEFGIATYVPIVADDVHLTISMAFEKTA